MSEVYGTERTVFGISMKTPNNQKSISESYLVIGAHAFLDISKAENVEKSNRCSHPLKALAHMDTVLLYRHLLNWLRWAQGMMEYVAKSTNVVLLCLTNANFTLLYLQLDGVGVESKAGDTIYSVRLGKTLQGMMMSSDSWKFSLRYSENNLTTPNIGYDYSESHVNRKYTSSYTLTP